MVLPQNSNIVQTTKKRLPHLPSVDVDSAHSDPDAGVNVNKEDCQSSLTEITSDRRLHAHSNQCLHVHTDQENHQHKSLNS
jgi:hypothetical protein